MVDLLPLLAPVTCAVALLVIVITLVLKDKFRQDILASDGKTTIFKFFSIQGAAVLSLCGLFLWGLIYSTNNTNQSYRDYFANLPVTARGETHEETISKSLNQLRQYPKFEQENQELHDQLKNLAPKSSRPSFYAKIVQLEDEIHNWGGRSINLSYRIEEKAKVLELLLDVFKESNISINSDLSDLSQIGEDLKRYQRNKGFSVTGYLNRVTLDYITSDYVKSQVNAERPNLTNKGV